MTVNINCYDYLFDFFSIAAVRTEDANEVVKDDSDTPDANQQIKPDQLEAFYYGMYGGE